MHSFELYMPTRLVYGADSIEKLAAAAAPYGKRALITYGGGSVVRSGLLERVKKALAGFEVVEFSGIEPNPRVSSVNAAANLAREQKVDFIVAVGGGSVIDASKAIAAAVKYEGDAWDLVKDGSLIKDALPLFSVLTLAATGSEYDAPGVISNMQTNEKQAISSPLLFPKASFCDPSVSVSVPAWHTAAGAAVSGKRRQRRKRRLLRNDSQDRDQERSDLHQGSDQSRGTLRNDAREFLRLLRSACDRQYALTVAVPRH